MAKVTLDNAPDRQAGEFDFRGSHGSIHVPSLASKQYQAGILEH
jgi:hypothetical protein